MTATIDTWHCGGAVQNAISPNTFWLNGTGATTWNVTFTFSSAVGTVSFGLWDVTAGAALQTVGPLSGITSGNFSLGGTVTNGHIIAIFCNITAGGVTSFTAATTNNPITGNPHPVLKVRRSGAWVGIGGHNLRIRRSGAWVQVENVNSNNNVKDKAGLLVRRSGAWVSI